MRLPSPASSIFSFIVVKVSVKNSSIVKWAEKSEGYVAVRSRRGNLSTVLSCEDILEIGVKSSWTSV